MKTGVRSEGVLFAANGLVPKFTVGLGAFIAGSLISLVGFPVKAVPGTVDPDIVRQLALYYIPCVILLERRLGGGAATSTGSIARPMSGTSPACARPPRWPRSACGSRNQRRRRARRLTAPQEDLVPADAANPFQAPGA